MKSIIEAKIILQENGMKHMQLRIGALAILLTGSVAAAQTSTGEVDSHIATAKTAAGQDYRGTFVNLCLPSAPAGNRGAAAPAAAGARGANARGGGAAPGAPAARGNAGGAQATPDRAGWYASPYKVFDNLY